MPTLVQLLAVEDENSDATLLTHALVSCQTPYAIRRARTVDQALELIATHMPHAVVLDVDLPDTVALARFERIHSAAPTLPILPLCPNTAECIESVVAEVATTGYSSKPFGRTEFLAAIESRSGRSQSNAPVIDEAISELLPTFLGRRRSDVESLIRALKLDDFETIETLGHRMRGSGGAYAMPEVSRIGEVIEAAAQSHQPDPIRVAVGELDALLQRCDF